MTVISIKINTTVNSKGSTGVIPPSGIVRADSNTVTADSNVITADGGNI